MSKLVILGLAIVTLGWPAGPALACQSTYQEIAHREAQKRRDRRRADVVVIGTLKADERCDDFGQRCWAQLHVTEVQRGNSEVELSVRFESTLDMCDGRFWPSTTAHFGLFYLKRIARSEAYALVEFVRLKAPAE